MKTLKESVLAKCGELAEIETFVLENNYLFASGKNLEGHFVYQLGHENQDILLTFSESTNENYFAWPLAAQILGVDADQAKRDRHDLLLRAWKAALVWWEDRAEPRNGHPDFTEWLAGMEVEND